MDAYLLIHDGSDPSADPWRALRDLPEASPGLQFVDVPSPVDESVDIPVGQYIVFNAELFIPTDAQLFSELLDELLQAPSYEEILRLRSRIGLPPLPRTKSSCCCLDCI